MILTLVSEAVVDRQDGATELANQRSEINIPVPKRQETVALAPGEVALSGTHAHTEVHLVCLSKLQGLAGPVFGDVLASVEEIRFAFQGWPQEAFPVCFVYNRDGSPLASYGPVSYTHLTLPTIYSV